MPARFASAPSISAQNHKKNTAIETELRGPLCERSLTSTFRQRNSRRETQAPAMDIARHFFFVTEFAGGMPCFESASASVASDAGVIG